MRKSVNPFLLKKFGLIPFLFLLLCVNTNAQTCLQSDNFSSAVTLGATQAPGVWYADRYAPNGFAAPSNDIGGSSALKQHIDATDALMNRPAPFNTTFYNTQGRKYDLNAGTNHVEIKLYIPSAWATSNKRMAGLWGTALDAGSGVSGYPIIEFTSDGASPRFRAYETSTGVWVDLPGLLPAGFAYNSWVKLSITLLPSGEFEYNAGDLHMVTTNAAPDASVQITNLILQGHNYDPAESSIGTPGAGVNYDIYWDDFCAGHRALYANDNNVSGDVYTDAVGSNSNPGTSSLPYATIAYAISQATAGDIIYVDAGTYDEDVTVNKSLKITGAGVVTTKIRGIIGGSGSTVTIAANNVELSGFTITRLGNNTTDWNNAGLNAAGISVQGLAISGMLIHNNIITGNRNGMDINNSNGHTVRNNVITDNRTGLIFRNQTDNIIFQENEVTNNWTVGILFLDASGGTNVPVQTAVNGSFFNNNISGNWYGQIVDRQSGGSIPAPGTTNLKNFSGNWYGTNTPVVTTANSTEPGYAAQIPVAYGGTATPPGGQPDIAGPASANFDYTPYLDAGIDVNIETAPGLGTFGFQGSFSNLWVTKASGQTGATGRIQEALGLVSGSTVNVTAGTYNEAVVINTTVTLQGAGSTTILTPSAACSGNGITINANNTIVKDLKVTNYTYGIVVAASSVELNNIESVSNCTAGIEMSNGISGLTVKNSKINSNTGVGLRAGTAAQMSNITIDNCEVKGNVQGMFISATASGSNSFNNISIKNSDFSNNTQKGMYFEKLSNAVIENITMNNSGTDVTYNNNSGIDINLKYGSYSNITIKNNTLTNCGVNGTAANAEAAVALAIKARDDAPSYNTVPATLTNVDVLNNIIKGPQNGIRFGEFGKTNSTPAGVEVHKNNFIGPFGNKAIINNTPGTVDATCNWFGTVASGTIASSISGPVTYSPFLLDGTDDQPAAPGFQTSAACVVSTDLYVNNAYVASDDHFTTAAGNDATGTGASSAPYATIQKAIGVASAGNTIWVDAGTYRENIIVDKQLSIRGSNLNINPNTGGRVAESIIQPATSDPDPYSATAVTIVYFSTNTANSDFNGFTLDGDNPALTSTVNFANGANVDAIEAMAAYEGLSNTIISNNIIKNVSYAAIDFDNYYTIPSGTATGGNAIINNKFDNILPALFGIGALLSNNCYTTVTGNVMTAVRIGIQTGNFYNPAPGGTSPQISNNTIESQRLGIWHNLAYTGATSFEFANNNITTYPGSANSNGIQISSIQSSVGVKLTNNNVTGARNGINLWNNPTTNTITITGGTLTNCQVGVFANNYDGYNSNAGSSVYAITGVTTTNCDTAVWVRDNALNSNSATVALNINNATNTINGTGIGVLIEGGDASVNLNGAIPINFSTSLNKYFRYITNGINVPSGNINALGVKFGGTNGGGLTNAQLFATEDKIDHKIDWSDLGFVSVKANNDYVTANSFYTPNTIAAMVQRGIDAAGAGWIVNVNSGTYVDAVNVNKGIKLYGVNYNVSPNGGVRNAEAKLATLSGIMVNVTTTDPVEIKGFELANTGGVFDYSLTGVVGTTVDLQKNFFNNSIGVYFANAVNTTIVDNLCTFSSGADEGFALFGDYNGTTGTYADIHHNVFIDGQITGFNLSNIHGVVYNNTFDNIAYYGVLVANLCNLDIYQNVFTNIKNPVLSVTTYGAGVRFYDDAPGMTVNVHNNYFANNVIGISARPAFDFTGQAITIQNNSITGNTSNSIRNEGTAEMSATCNWFGTINEATIASGISGPVTYIPYLNSGNDAQPATMGFQPTAVCAGCTLLITGTDVTNVKCKGGSDGSVTVNVLGAVDPAYLWSPGGQTTQTATGLIAGTYTITVTNANGCTATTTATVTQPAAALSGGITSKTNATNCSSNGSVTVAGSGGTSPYAYSKDDGAHYQSGGTFGSLAAGHYTITVKDANGCTVQVDVTITGTTSPNAGTVSGESKLCIGSTTTFTSNGTSGGTWSSSNTGVAKVNVSSGVITGVAAGTATIKYTVSNSCGSKNATKSITVSAAPNPGTISGASAVCVGSTTNFTSNGNSGGTWSSSNSTVATVSSTGVVKGISAGTATIKYTVTKSCGSKSATRSITVSTASNAGTVSGASTVCAGSTTTFSSNGNGGGSWSSSNTAVAKVNASSGVITGVAAGTATIKYTVTNACGSKNATKSITVKANSPVIACPSGSPFTKNAGATCQYTIAGNEFNASATSTCGTPSLSYTLSGATSGTGTSLSGIKLNKGVTTIKWKATNRSLSSTCSITVTVKDNQPPTITCKPGATRKIASSSSYYTVSGTEFTPGTSDNCGTPTLMYCLSGATITDGYVAANTPLAGKKLYAGSTTIRWKATDGSDNTATCTTIVTVTKASARGDVSANVSEPLDGKTIEPTPGQLIVRAMPNPTTTHFTLEIKSVKRDKVNVRVIDLSGRVVEVKPGINSNSIIQIGNSYFPGTYITEITQGKEKVIMKLIKISR